MAVDFSYPIRHYAIWLGNTSPQANVCVYVYLYIYNMEGIFNRKNKCAFILLWKSWFIDHRQIIQMYKDAYCTRCDQWVGAIKRGRPSTQKKQETVATQERPETPGEGQSSGCSPHEQAVCMIIGTKSTSDGSSIGFLKCVQVPVCKRRLQRRTSLVLLHIQSHNRALCVSI